jgi:hypothetical protein
MLADHKLMLADHKLMLAKHEIATNTNSNTVRKRAPLRVALR